MPTLFPSILPNKEPFVDDKYQRRELERMDRTELQQLAAKHPSDDVNGKQSNEDIIDGLEGEERV